MQSKTINPEKQFSGFIKFRIAYENNFVNPVDILFSKHAHDVLHVPLLKT
jgi:hypothetical protein